MRSGQRKWGMPECPWLNQKSGPFLTNHTFWVVEYRCNLPLEEFSQKGNPSCEHKASITRRIRSGCQTLRTCEWRSSWNDQPNGETSQCERKHLKTQVLTYRRFTCSPADRDAAPVRSSVIDEPSLYLFVLIKPCWAQSLWYQTVISRSFMCSSRQFSLESTQISQRSYKTSGVLHEAPFHGSSEVITNSWSHQKLSGLKSSAHQCLRVVFAADLPSVPKELP